MAIKKEMEEKMLASIEEKTGMRPQLIIDTVRKQSIDKHSDKIKFIKAEFGLSHGFANILAHKSNENAEKEIGAFDTISAQYQDKEHLKPILDKILDIISGWESIEVSPKKTYVSLRTKKQFALLQPSTKTRVDLGLKLSGVDTTEILEKSGSFNSMVSHRIRLTDVDDIDKSVLFLLKLAYEQSK